MNRIAILFITILLPLFAFAQSAEECNKKGEETAYKYDEMGHGLFTYFLLKKLRDTKGDVTMGELSSYIKEQVKRYSIVENGKSQTPSIMTSGNLNSTWQSLKFY